MSGTDGTATTSPRDVMTTYFSSWRDRDFDRFESILADDVTFRGPMGEVDNAADCRRAIAGLREILDDVRVTKMFVDGPDVLTWFELHPSGGSPVPVANWSHVEDGRVRSIRVTFDPRPLL